jgi:hypothetical protein
MAGPAMIWAVGRAGGRCQQRTHPGSERMPDVDQADEPASRLLQEIMSDVEELIARRDWKTDPRGRVALGESLDLAAEVLRLPATGPYDPPPAAADRPGDLRRPVERMRPRVLTGIDVVQAAADKRDVNASPPLARFRKSLIAAIWLLG